MRSAPGEHASARQLVRSEKGEHARPRLETVNCFKSFFDVLLSAQLVVVYKLNGTVLADHKRLPTVKQAEQVAGHGVELAHVLGFVTEQALRQPFVALQYAWKCALTIV